MTAMQLTCPDLSLRQEPGRSTAAIEQDVKCSGMPADKPATVSTQFQPIDPGIVSEAIPAFFIGRNKEGFWVARDVKGRLAEFSCSRTPRCRSQERIVSRRGAQQYFRPNGSNSTSKTKEIRCSGISGR